MIPEAQAHNREMGRDQIRVGDIIERAAPTLGNSAKGYSLVVA